MGDEPQKKKRSPVKDQPCRKGCGRKFSVQGLPMHERACTGTKGRSKVQPDHNRKPEPEPTEEEDSSALFF